MNMLKFLCLVILSAPIFASLHPKDYGPNLAEAIRHLHAECSIITGVSDLEIENVRNGNFAENNIRIKRYNTCLWLHSGVMLPSYDGVINLHGNKNYLLDLEPPKLKGKFAKMFMSCIDEARESGEKNFTVLAWNATKCLHRTDPENFVYP
ncbi:unnamed protein product [Psylliodes chrysocephalus]|uniref:Uncharacterized protein n=1 Tax=Psylliodes chrysocephalus TaxID=3402493 RepID=A0A9P0CIF9_9CUCU|nr:unnamed protein product [Psylliodes chrysocephala]